MDHLNHYRQIIRSTLQPYTEISYANVDVRNRAAFDPENDQYLIISEGWDHERHLHSVLIHIEIINTKVWVQWYRGWHHQRTPCCRNSPKRYCAWLP
jgi:hypothetical protein